MPARKCRIRPRDQKLGQRLRSLRETLNWSRPQLLEFVGDELTFNRLVSFETDGVPEEAASEIKRILLKMDAELHKEQPVPPSVSAASSGLSPLLVTIDQKLDRLIRALTKFGFEVD